MRSVSDVLKEVSAGWKNYTDVERNSIATAVAGTRQKEAFLTLMENFPKALEYAGLAFDSAGTAEEKFNAYLSGTEKAINSLKAAWEKFSKDLVSSDLIKNAVNTLAKAIKFLNSTTGQFIVKTTLLWAQLKLGAVVIGGLMAKLKTGALISWITNLGKGFSLLVKHGTAATKTAYLMKNGFEAEEAAAKAASAATSALNLVLAAASLVAMGVITAIKKAEQKEEERRQKAKEDLQNLQDQRKSLDELVNKYKELKSAAVQDESTREQIESIQNQINELVGEEASNLDLVNGALDTQLNKLNKIQLQKLKDAKTNANIVAANAKKKAKNLGTYTLGEAIGTGLSFLGIGEDKGYQSYSSMFKEILEEGNIGKLKLIQSQLKSQIASGEEVEGTQQFLEELTQIIEALEEAEQITQKINFAEAIEGKEFKTEKDFKEFRDNYIKGLEEAGEQTEYVKELFKQTFPEFYGGIETAAEKASKLRESLKTLNDVYKNLNSIIEDINENGSISYENFEALLNIQPQYLKYLFDENGQLRNQTSALEDLMKAEALQQAKQSALAFVESLRGYTKADIINLLGLETSATQVLTSAIMEEIKAKILSLHLDEETSNLILKRTSAIVSAANSIRIGSNQSSKSASKEDKYAKAISYVTTTIEKKIKALQKEKQAIEDLNEARQKELDQYDKALSYINKYIASKIKELEDEKKALEDKNDEVAREIELEELRNNLQKARQRTMRVYYEGQGWIWETNPEDLKEAQKAMDDFQVENLTKAIEDLIEQWQEYSDLWAKIPDEYDDYAEKMAFEQNQSFVKEEDLRNRNLSGLERFKKAYFDKEKLITETTTENIDKQIDKLNELKDKWSNIKSDIEYEQNALIAQELLGSSLESDILDGRIKNIQSFASEYANYMNSAALAAESASRRINGAFQSIDFDLINEVPSGAPDTGFMSASEFQTYYAEQQGFEKKYEALEQYWNWWGKDINSTKKDQAITALWRNILGVNVNHPFVAQLYNFLSENKGRSFSDLKTRLKKPEYASLATFLGITDSKKTGAAKKTSTYASGTKNSRASIANVDELGNELIIDPPTHGRYTVLRDGSGVLPHNLTQRIFEVATNPIGYIRQALRGVNPNALGSISGSSTNNNTNININKLDLPNVSNVEQFVKELQIISANR